MYVEVFWKFYVQLFFDGSTIPEFIGWIHYLDCMFLYETNYLIF